MIPGIGFFVAAGPAISLIGGVTIGAALGNLSGALIEMGIGEEDVTSVLSGLEEGKILIAVTVTNPDKQTAVWDLFANCGAKEVRINHHGALHNSQ
jgi:uncharacterized membrane protein